jgi:hypothetical protein
MNLRDKILVADDTSQRQPNYTVVLLTNAAGGILTDRM